jgi:hypothetical protein
MNSAPLLMMTLFRAAKAGDQAKFAARNFIAPRRIAARVLCA